MFNSTPAEGSEIADIRLRSGTVARLAGIPVATLRIWERRYRVVAAPKSAGGQRLYSAHDVQRLRLLRSLSGKGHAIGTIAMLTLAQLQALSDSAASALGVQAEAKPRVAMASVCAIGPGFAERLREAGVPVASHFDKPADARQALAADPAGSTPLLVVQMATLQPAGAAEVMNLASRAPAAVVMVCYAFSTESVVEGLRSAGVQMLREPLTGPDLARFVTAAAVAAAAGCVDSGRQRGPVLPMGSPRRFSDADLRRLGAVQTGVACECPHHLAELVLLLTAFERYSAECEAESSPVGAEVNGDLLRDLHSDLHGDLNRLAGAARALLETALDRVVAAEGL